MEQNVQPTPQAAPPPTNNSNIFIGILVFILGIAVGLIIDKTTLLSTVRIPYLGATPTPTPLPTPTPESEALGIQINVCCSCPTKVSRSLIDTDGWVIYERGKNYAEFLPEECDRVDCQPCPPLDTKSYICPPTGWVDCMPILTPEAQAACSTEAIAWYKANCPDFKGVAQ